MRPWFHPALALVLLACGGAQPAPEPTTADKDTRVATAKHVRGLVQDLYRAVRLGNGGSMQTLLADDAWVAGPRAADLFASRGDAIVAAVNRFDVDSRHKVKSRGIVAESSPSGQAAWVADRVDVDRKRHVLVVVLASIDDIWYAQAVNLGRIAGGTNAESAPGLFETAADNAADNAADTAADNAPEGTEDVVELVRAGAAEPALFLEQWADNKRITLIGPGVRDFARGAKRIKRHWKKKKLADKPMTLVGEPRAGATPDRSLVWVMAHITVAESSPRRAMWIYERADDDTYRLVLMQSAPIKADPKSK